MPRENQSQVKPDGRFRHQFDTTIEERDRLDRIRQRASLRTYAEALRVAIRVFDWLLKKKEEGYSIVIVKDGETKDVELLW